MSKKEGKQQKEMCRKMYCRFYSLQEISGEKLASLLVCGIPDTLCTRFSRWFGITIRVIRINVYGVASYAPHKPIKPNLL